MRESNPFLLLSQNSSCPPLHLTHRLNTDGTENIARGTTDPKKMSHKDFELKSLLEVRFYFSTCVLESEFSARFIWPL